MGGCENGGYIGNGWRKFSTIRVAIDILHPLCRGRKITYDGRFEGWVFFKYERLPNICYWCGRVTHDDKDCSL